MDFQTADLDRMFTQTRAALEGMRASSPTADDGSQDQGRHGGDGDGGDDWRRHGAGGDGNGDWRRNGGGGDGNDDWSRGGPGGDGDGDWTSDDPGGVADDGDCGSGTGGVIGESCGGQVRAVMDGGRLVSIWVDPELKHIPVRLREYLVEAVNAAIDGYVAGECGLPAANADHALLAQQLREAQDESLRQMSIFEQAIADVVGRLGRA